MHNTSRITCFTIVLGLISNLGLITNAAPLPLVLFEDSNFRGVRTEYMLNGPETCVNIGGKLNDFFSSVQNSEPGSCFLLCEHEYCRGRCVQVTQSLESLNLINFNDMASSIQRCPPSTSTPPTTITATTGDTTETVPVEDQSQSESVPETTTSGSPQQ